MIDRREKIIFTLWNAKPIPLGPCFISACFALCPMLYALCAMRHAPCAMRSALRLFLRGDHISLGTQRLFMSFNRSTKKLNFF